MTHPPLSQFVSLKEGFSFGRLNNEGYNNPFNYVSGMSIDVLVMGTSNMLAMEVMPNENTSGVLRKLSGKIIYNIGMSAHYLPICARNLKAALKKYKPLNYVVIETPESSFSSVELNDIINNNVPLHEAARKSRGFLRLILRENFYLYLLYGKYGKIFDYKNNDDGNGGEVYTFSTDPILLNKVLRQMSETVKNFSRGAKLIIAYHPSSVLNKDGSLKILADNKAVKVFSDACAANGIYFVDLSERFLSEYEKNYILPNGFFNSSVGSGHLNKHGHRMLAEEIYKLMQKIEN